VGQFISTILGTAWTVITFFVVPVLVVERVGPLDAIKRSVALLRKAWGEALVGNVGIGFFMFLLMLPGFLMFGIGMLVASKVLALGLGVIALAVLYLLGCGAVSSALHTIFLGALYQYAAHESVPRGFDRGELENAFAKKR
ncbi:MAG: DUF6159 family protein, partial [Candidatus Acidiferrum sp.]